MRAAFLRVGLLMTLLLVSLCASVSQTLVLHPAEIELVWPAAVTNAGDQTIYPDYSLFTSHDLVDWTRAPGNYRGVEGRPMQKLAIRLPRAASAPMFFRLKVQTRPEITAALVEGGANQFGYNSRFDLELKSLGPLSVQDFATNAPQPSYLPQLTWDVTTAQFWNAFNSTNRHVLHYGGLANSGTNLEYHFQPDDQEFGILQTNGFVVSARMGSPSFGDAYYRIFNADLPVFITADSVLHAWHKSYQNILAELEELWTSTLLERMLTWWSSQLPGCWQLYGNGPLANSIVDADYFLTIARSLLAGNAVPTSLGNSAQDQLVLQTLAAVTSQSQQALPIFGDQRIIDFTQFKPRGHYDTSDRLRRYFQAMMWLGRVDLRIATFKPNNQDDIRQLGTAIVLNHSLRQSGYFDTWAAIEKVGNLFVGFTDSMTFSQLGDLVTAFGVHSLSQVTSLAVLTNLQASLLSGQVGAQSIHSDILLSPYGPEQVRLARSFTASGQKFVLDSWVMSQVVFDRVLWEEGSPQTIFTKVLRRKPSCLDIAYSVLGNDQVMPELISRMENREGVRFRDGLPYHHNLLAARKTVDGQTPIIWRTNTYMAWLSALRALSKPTTGPEYPEAMRTRAWSSKTLNTQLASWTQLRHDTLLYAKQSYTEQVLCSYPAGFVEPLPEFWLRMKTVANVTASAILGLPMSGSQTYSGCQTTVTFDLESIKNHQVAFLNRFARSMIDLFLISNKELAQEPLDESQLQILRNVVERSIDYTGQKRWNGWYPALFYTNSLFRLRSCHSAEPNPVCDDWDALVADVHTDVPDELVGDPGAVIHEGVGNVHMMLIAIDNGSDRMMYAGPVMSHYEFELPGIQRWSNADWKATLRSGFKTPAPTWTRSYLVPSSTPIPPGY